MVRSGAADALHHIYSIPRLAAESTIVLRAPEVGALLRHLGQLQPLRTPALSSSADQGGLLDHVMLAQLDRQGVTTIIRQQSCRKANM